MADDKMLHEAVEAIRHGQQDKAREILTRLLRTDKKNPIYWLYMSSIVDSDKERIYCLESALKIDPKNDTAKRGLVLLGSRKPDNQIKPIKPNRQREWGLGEIGAAPGSLGRDNRPTDSISTTRLISIVGIGVIAFSFLVFGIFGNPFGDSNLNFFGLRGPSATFLPGLERGTPLPTLANPTPLVELLDISYTITPRYVDTPHPSTEAYRSAMASFDRGNWTSAIGFLEQAIEIDPRGADLYYHLGEAYMRLEEYRDALAAFEKAVDIDEEFAPAFLGRALSHLAMNPDGLFFEDINKAANLAPEMPEVYIVRSAYRLHRGNPDGALIDTRTGERLGVESAQLYLTRAKAHFLEDEYPEAIAAAQHSLEIDATLLETYFVLSQSLNAEGRIAEAISQLQIYLQYDEENAQGWYLLGKAMFNAGYHEDSIPIFDTAYELDSTLFPIYYYRGAIQFENTEYDASLENVEHVLRFSPQWFEPNMVKGKILYLTKDVGTAYLFIESIGDLPRTDEQLAEFYFWYALSLEGVEEFELAAKNWTLLLELPGEAVPPNQDTTARNHLLELEAELPPTRTSTPFPTFTPAPSATPTP